MRGHNVFAMPMGSSPSAFDSSTSALEALFAPRPVQAADPTAVPENAPEGSYTYALVQSAPAIDAEEVESAAQAIEIRITWGASVLHVAHLTPARSFYVGADEAKDRRADFALPVDALGAVRAPLVLAEPGGGARVVAFPRATGRIELPGQPALSLADAIASGLATPCEELAGAYAIALPSGGRVRIESAGLTFEVAAVKAGRKVAGRVRLDGRSLPYTALSMALHLGVLAAAAVFMPPMAMADEEGVPADQIAALRFMLTTTSEKETEQKPDDATTDTKTQDREGGTGAQAMGESGKMGSQTSSATNRRYAVEGPADNADPHIAKSNMLRDAGTFGVIGILSSLAAGDPSSPTAVWGRDEALGNDPRSANGNLWGQEIGDAAGLGGLGLTGIGEGGGGRYEGIGLGALGTIGHGSGLGPGQGFGPGNGTSHGIGRGKHEGRGPVMRVATTNVSGHIPPEVIQRIVRQNFGRFRLCYENGLRNSPNLAGRVSVRFVIGRDGAVSSAANGGSDLPDGGVVSCVTRAFYGLSFPQPDEGIVTVTYPIMFSPGT
jgi:hypothetical protein